jgi:hypothetical protein
MSPPVDGRLISTAGLAGYVERLSSPEVVAQDLVRHPVILLV